MILLTGATGTIGRATLQLLRKKGQDVIAVTRDGAKASLPSGTRIFTGNPSTPATLADAFAGVDAMLLSPRAVGESSIELLALAARHGVKRVVVLSAVTVEYGGGYARFSEGFKAIESAAVASGLGWTILRSAPYAANAMAWSEQIKATGSVSSAYGNARTSPIHERDVAAIAALALLEDEHAGNAYAMTGPQSLTQRDQIRLLGEATDQALTFNEVPAEQVRQSMIAQGAPADVPDRMLGYLAACIDQPGPTTDVVERLLGRSALAFLDWAKEHGAAFKR